MTIEAIRGRVAEIHKARRRWAEGDTRSKGGSPLSLELYEAFIEEVVAKSVQWGAWRTSGPDYQIVFVRETDKLGDMAQEVLKAREAGK